MKMYILSAIIIVCNITDSVQSGKLRKIIIDHTIQNRSIQVALWHEVNNYHYLLKIMNLNETQRSINLNNETTNLITINNCIPDIFYVDDPLCPSDFVLLLKERRKTDASLYCIKALLETPID